MNARRREFFRPLVESLEPRRLLACEVLFQDGKLTILGDSSDNTIEVFVARQGIHVTCDGVLSGPFGGVQSVLVLGGPGREGMKFDAEDALGAGALKDTDADGLPEIVDFYGGPGIDAFEILASPAKRLTLDGGQQADRYSIQFSRLFGSVHVNDSGKGGRDSLTLLGTEDAEKIALAGGGRDAWIAKWEGPDLDGSGGNDVPLETIEIAHEGIQLAEVRARDGDDLVEIDDRSGLLHPIDINVFFQGGRDCGQFYSFHPGQSLGLRGDGSVQFIGEELNDHLTIIGSDLLGERFAARSGGESGLVEIDVTDILMKRQLASVGADNLEGVSFKGGDGDDEFDFDVNEDGLVTPVDVLGGSGNDRLTIAATRLAELIEIFGVERIAPDPLIRGTNLATGAPLFEASVFETEAITVDARGGDDRVVMREVDASLADVDWRILAGAGNDLMDARLAAIPDVLHVLTGQGDDDVSIKFADNPNVPTMPPDPNAPAPEISVDVGGGVDSLVLDVFGSLAPPPNDLGDVSASVTLTEVLASIFITGVGLMSVLTLFPLGALEMQLAVRDDRAGNTKTEAAIALAGPDLAVDLATGATLDSVLVDLAPLRESKVDLKLSTGREDDRIEVRSRSAGGDIDWSLDAQPGSGDDEVLVSFEHGDIDRPVILGTIWNPSHSPADSSPGGRGRLQMHAAASMQDSQFDLAFDLAGNTSRDVAALDLDLPDDSGFARYRLDIVADLGQGDDDFTVAGSDGSSLRRGTWILDATYHVDAGPGNDLVAVTAVPGGGDSQQKVRIDTGDGADGVTVLLRRLANPHLPQATPTTERLDLDVSTGPDADRVDVNVQSAAENALQKVRIDTGDGADRASVIWRKLQLQAEFPNAVETDVSIDTGGGNDRAEVELEPGSAADNLYSFKLQLGTGNDTVRYWVFGTELPPATREPIDHAAVNVEFQVLGGQGNDDIEGRIGSDSSGQFVPVAFGHARIEIDGGAGSDRLSLDFRGPILDGAAVDAVLRGGAGDDQVRARFELDPESTGRLSARVLGEGGSDELGLAVLNAENLDLLLALLDGGPGKDRCRTTPNVLVQNCP